MMAGGIPVYIPTVRTAWGLIGPMRWDALDQTAARSAIRNHPLVTEPVSLGASRAPSASPSSACTYDATIPQAELISSASATSALHLVR